MAIDIDELILRALRGEASDAELRELAEWREESPDNERRFQEISRIVRLAPQLEEPLDTRPVTARSVIERAGDRSASEPARSGRSRWWSRREVLSAAAAAAAVLVIALGLGDLWPDGGGVAPPSETRTVYESGAESGRSIELPNGILVYLGPSSRLEATESEQGPAFRLEGNAFFGVPEQDEHRVTVRTSGGRLTVLGTRFGVRSADDDMELVVVEGRVRVEALDRDFQVGAAGMGIVRDGRVENVARVEDPLDHLGWMGGAMVFESTPLREVAREIQRRYGVDIQIRSPEVEDRTVTTVFDGQPFVDVMNIVCRVTDVTCTVSGDRAVIEP